MLLEKIPKSDPSTPLKTTSIMTYELGSVIKALVYAEHSQLEEDTRKAYVVSAYLDFVDLITQARILAEQLDWDWSIAVSFGEERFDERMQELREGTI